MKIETLSTSLILVIICSIQCSVLNGMEKQNRHRSLELLERPRMLHDVIKERYYLGKNINATVQIVFSDTIKNKGGLAEVWQTVLDLTPVTTALYKLENNIIVQVNVTEASKKLKKHFKPQITAKTLRHIQSGKTTGPPIQPAQLPPQKNPSLLYSTACGLALFSAGWLGKTWWDAGGKDNTIALGTYILKYLLAEFNQY